MGIIVFTTNTRDQCYHLLHSFLTPLPTPPHSTCWLAYFLGEALLTTVLGWGFGGSAGDGVRPRASGTHVFSQDVDRFCICPVHTSMHM